MRGKIEDVVERARNEREGVKGTEGATEVAEREQSIVPNSISIPFPAFSHSSDHDVSHHSFFSP